MSILVVPARDASFLTHAVNDDERLAARTSASVLVTAPSSPLVSTLARRVHTLSGRERFPFVETRAAALPTESGALTGACAALLDAAAGGSVMLCDVEETPRSVQERLIELFERLALDRKPSAGVRLISGTTVSLFECVEAGTFSAQFFYRLNVIHIKASGRPEDQTGKRPADA